MRLHDNRGEFQELINLIAKTGGEALWVRPLDGSGARTYSEAMSMCARLAPEEFGDVRWLPADREVVRRMMDAGKEG